MPAFNALPGAAAVLVPVGATGAADRGDDRGAVAVRHRGGAVRGGGTDVAAGVAVGDPDRAVGFSLGVYLVVRGFRPEAVDRLLASR